MIGLLADRGAAPAISAAYKSVSNKYVDINFDRGVYADLTRVNPVTTSNFSITNFSGGGTTSIAIASVKRNTHYTAASALALIGGETTVRAFITLTGTPTSVETFTIQCTDIFSGDRVKSSPVTGTIKLNITPMMMFDYLETASITTAGLGISQVTDIISGGVISQGTDNNRPIKAGDFLGFNFSTTPEKHMTGGDVGILDFQKGNSFTVCIKRLNVLNSGTSGWVIANRANDPGNNGWSIQVGTDGSLFFAMHDGTLQGFCDYDSYAGSGENTLFFVNSNGTMNIRDEVGTALGTTGDATGLGTISYTGVNFLLGRRGNNTTSWLHGWWEKVIILQGALTTDQIIDLNDNL